MHVESLLKCREHLVPISVFFIYGVALAVASMYSATAQPVQAVGYLDRLTPTYAAGWGCVPGTKTQANIVVYAGTHRIGIYPTTIPRPDTIGSCSETARTAGFRIALTSTEAQQLLFGPDLSFFALAPGAAPFLLPSSDPAITDPFSLPSGELTNLNWAGALEGVVTSIGSQAQGLTISTFGGGPPQSGGRLIGFASLAAIPLTKATQRFSENLPSAFLADLPPGYLPSIYAAGSYGQGPPVQLGSPLIPGAKSVGLSAAMRQAGSVSGLTNSIYTYWVDGDYAFAGLSGLASFAGNDPSFSESLLTVGFSSDNEANCKQKNGTSPNTAPALTRLAAVIMKSNDTVGDTLPISISLPYGIQLAGPTGTCLLLWISAGYPFLNPYSAKYAYTSSQLAITLTHASNNAPRTVAEGLGDEFRFPVGSGSSQFAVVSMRLNTATELDAIAGSISAGGITGAPNTTNLWPSPTGNWTASSSFYALNATQCRSLGLTYGPGNQYYAIARSTSPTLMHIPHGARLLKTVALYGLAAIVSEQTFFWTFSSPMFPISSTVIMQAGECIAAFHNLTPLTGSLDGVLDLESQSTVYLHLLY